MSYSVVISSDVSLVAVLERHTQSEIKLFFDTDRLLVHFVIRMGSVVTCFSCDPKSWHPNAKASWKISSMTNTSENLTIIF